MRSSGERGARAGALVRHRWRAAAVLAGMVMAACYLSWPFATDHGIFAWIASRILEGAVVYRDAWDTKGPASFYLTVPAVWAFGRHQWGLRAYDLCWLAAAAVAVRALVRAVERRSGERLPAAAAASAALLCLWYFSLDPYQTAQPDGWAGFLVAIGAVGVLRAAPGRTAVLAAAGWAACVGVATLVKPTYGLLGVPVLVYAPLRVRADGGSWREVAAVYAAAGATLAAVLGGCALWLAYRGALADFVDAYLVYGPQVYARVDSPPALVRVREAVQDVFALFGLALPLVVAGGAWLYARARAEALFVFAWVGAVLASLLIQGRFGAPYRWLPIYPALALLAGLGAGALLEWRERGGVPARQVAAAIVAVTLAGAAFTPAYHVFRWGKYVAGRSSAEEYYTPSNAPEWGWFGGPGSLGEIADYVAARTAPSDYVLAWGSQVGVNFLAARPTPARFAWSGALTYGAGTRFRRDFRREFMARLGEHPPAYVTAFDDETCARHAQDSYWCLKSFPELEDFVRQRYRREAHIGQYDVFRRVD